MAVLVLVVNVASAGISFWGGDPRVMLAKEGAPQARNRIEAADAARRNGWL
jgi:hypothetical protein